MKTLGSAHLRRVRTLEFSDLRAGDIVLIRTKNNLYSFSVANERTLCGRLLSGLNKGQFPDAVLVGAVGGREGGRQMLTSRLVTQAQALFAIQRGNAVIRLTTSTVVSLCCVRPMEENHESARTAFEPT